MEKQTMAFAGLMIMFIVLNTRPSIGGCKQALMEFIPCASLGLGPGTGEPGAMRCAGIKLVVSQADTTEKRRSLWQCLKDKAIGAGVKIDPGELKHIPDACGVKIPIPLDPNVDWNSIPAFLGIAKSWEKKINYLQENSIPLFI